MTQQEVIQAFMKSLDETDKSGTAALDEAIDYATKGTARHFKTIAEAIEGMKSDISLTGDADKFLKDFCGIIIDNDDTGAITGSDMGGSEVKTAKNIVLESGNLDTSFNENQFTLYENTKPVMNVLLSDFNSTGGFLGNLSCDEDLTPKKKYIWQAFKTWWAQGALDLVTKSYGSNFGFASSSLLEPKSLYFGFYNRDDSSLAESGPWADTTGKETIALALRVNISSFESVVDNDSDGSSYTGEYLDRTLAHEFTHCVMAANINYYKFLPQFVKEGIAELTIGADDGKRTKENIRQLANKSSVTETNGNKSRLDIALDLNNTNTGVADSYDGGYMFFHWLAKQAADSDGTINNTVNNTSLIGSVKADNVKNSGSYVTISSGAGNDTITNFLKSGGGYGNYALIDSGDGQDKVSINGSYYVSVNGGADNDTITDNGGYKSYYNGGAGNDLISIKSTYWDFTLEGGTGNDTIISNTAKTLYKYTLGDGNDSIVGFNANSTLSISGSYSTIKSGSDIIIAVGNDKITLANAASLSTINIDDTASENTTLTLTNNSNSKVTLGASIELADASKRTKAIRIVGNALDNTFLGGTGNDTLYGGDGGDYIEGNAGNDKLYGQNGNDTLWGGTGNDTLTGGAGDNIFIYTAGKDVIADYAEGDMISIGAAISKSSVSGSDAIFTIGSSTLKVKNGKGKEITFLDADGNELSIIGGAYLATNSMTSKITLASSYNVADATARTTAAIRIVGNAKDNSILGGSKNDTLYGKDGDDSIDGNAGNDKLYGNEGNDTLWGGTGNDTLTGGAGDDVFIYSAGKDVIADYAEGDMISIGAAISKSSVSGSDAIFTIGSSTLKVKNGKGKEITFLDADGNERSIIGGTIGLALTDKSSVKTTAAATYELLDATARTKAIQITGNALDNTLLGGTGKDTLYGGDGGDYIEGNAGNDKLYGQAGNDTLWGGKGNDTLIGGDGADVFLYASGEGNDVISGFANNDMLLITGDFSASYDKTAKTVAFDFYGGSITLKDFTASSFNVNGFKYRIKGNKLVRK